MRRTFLRRGAPDELEVTDPGSPVKAGCGLVVLVCVIESAIVDRIDRYVAVVAPAVSRRTLAAGAVEKMLFA
jgi:hypothetical protein